MIEQFIPGQEIQVAIINGKLLGAIELVPKRKFYDYKAKYTKSAKTEHIMPARLSKSKYLEVLNIAKKLMMLLNAEELQEQIWNFLKVIFIY